MNNGEENLVFFKCDEDGTAKDAIGVVKTRTAIEHEQHVHKYEIDCVGLMFVLMFYLSLQI